jgi:hypothetical protein
MSTRNKPGASPYVDVSENKGSSRRNFLSTAAAAGLVATGLAGCSKVKDYFPGKGHEYGKAVDLGFGDIGILNFAYMLEQLEAAFYVKAMDMPYSGIASQEKAMLTDIRNHEIAHREFFKNALGKDAIIGLDFDFSSIDFKSRTSVLATAKAFEDLGVSAYNGAGTFIADTGYLLIAGKIVSVEARHAAYIRNLINYGSFADSSVIDNNGLDTSRKPKDVVAIAEKYIKNRINANGLPS